MVDTGGAVAAPEPRGRVPHWLDRGAAHGWRLLVLAAVVVVVVELLSRLLVVVLPVFAALLLARALRPVSRRLERVLPRSLAAALAVLGFVAVVAGGLATVGVLVADELGDLGPTLDRALRTVEDWVARRRPFGLERADVADVRTEASDTLRNLVRGSGDQALAGARTAGELLVGTFLCVLVTFFALKDGERAVRRSRRLVPSERREVVTRMGQRAWATLGGYLRGAAILGLVEGTVIAVTMAIVGARLALVVLVLTFVGAFVPLVGAVAAGLVAVLVTAVTAGPAAAGIVAVVALVVQQLDNDLLAPVIYGRALSLHPVAVLLGITAGSALFGLVGTFLAVPVLAVAVNVWDEARSGPAPPTGGPAPPV